MISLLQGFVVLVRCGSRLVVIRLIWQFSVACVHGALLRSRNSDLLQVKGG